MVGLGELDVVGALDALVAAAVTANCAIPTRPDCAPIACRMCTPGDRLAGTANSIRTVPVLSAVAGGSEIGSEKSVTATPSPGVKPVNTTT